MRWRQLSRHRFLPSLACGKGWPEGPGEGSHVKPSSARRFALGTFSREREKE
jgi:hypothetical protein